MDAFLPSCKTRYTVYKKFYDALVRENAVFDLGVMPIEIQRISANLERGVYNHVVLSRDVWDARFIRMYLDKATTILTNIKSDSYIGNRTFGTRVLTHQVVNEFDIPKMKSQDMFPEHWEAVRARMEVEEKAKYDFTVEEMYDSIYKCPKCKSYKVEYNEVFSRSADEPSVKHCHCTKCGKRWKVTS